MRDALIYLALAVPAFAAIGDHAPSVPSTYVTSHPRLPYPDSGYTASLWAARSTTAAYIWTAASAWNSATPGQGSATPINFRYLLLAYIAEAANGGPNTATYLQKIKDVTLEGGSTAPRTYSITDGVGAGTVCTAGITNCTFTTSAGNFLSGCSAGSCLNFDIAINGKIFQITTIDGTGLIATISGNYAPIAGSGNVGAVITHGADAGPWTPCHMVTLAYDWIYNDLDSTSRTVFRQQLYGFFSKFKSGFDTGAAPPYNDQFYIDGGIPFLLPALAVYPDDPTNSLPMWRYAADIWINIMLPAWKQVIGGGSSGNFGTPCGSSNDSDTGCGGGWHEGWVDYFAGGPTSTRMNNWYVTFPLAWWKATGDPIFTREGWLKNLAYWPMYIIQPDWNVARVGANARGYFLNECQCNSSGSGMGMLGGLAEIYNDPTIRGFSRLINWANATPNGFEPSAWPFYAPDTSGKSVNTRSVLSKSRNFPGWGKIFLRTGWGEDDTYVTLSYGNTYWSHPVADAGAFTIFERGSLAIRSGTYKGGSAGDNWIQYTDRALSQNALLMYDVGDYYSAETWGINRSDGSTTNDPLHNDGGQRPVGAIGAAPNSPYSTNMLGTQSSPADLSQWARSREYYNAGELLAYTVGTGNAYTFVAIDVTRAYNNYYSHNAHTGSWNAHEANSSNRSYRAQKAIRHFLFIPRGTAAYLAVYDQITTSTATFVKKWLIHSVNAPAISGNAFTITRADLATSSYSAALWPQEWASQLTHCPSGCSGSSTQYQYSGELYGWVTLPNPATLTTVGGAGHEFDITDSSGTANHNECMQSLCSSAEGTGSTTGFINPIASVAPMEPGSYRIEETVGANNLSDSFINVMLATSNVDTNVVSTVPTTSASSSNWVTTWKDNSDTCTYTWTVPQAGVGGTLTTIGAGCATVIN